MGLLLSWHSLGPGGPGHCGHSACSLGKCCPVDFAPAGSHTHPGSQMCKEGLLLGVKRFYRSSQPDPPFRIKPLCNPKVSRCCSHNGYIQ